jgi:hypothetical protein
MSRSPGMVAVVFLSLISGSAFAQNLRSAVASTGLDSNPCTVASPCRSFTTALANTNAGGEVIALDSAGYGPFQVQGDMTVSGAPGVHAAVTASGGVNAIGVTALLAHIVIRNLILISNGGLFGVSQSGGGDTYYDHLVVRGFSAGIAIGNGTATVDHCTVVDNATNGIQVSSFSGRVRVTVTDSLSQGNGSSGISATGSTDVGAVRCTLSGNSTGAYADASGTGIHATVALKECTVTNNGTAVSAAAGVSNDTAVVYLADNLIAYNGTVASASGAASIYTFSNNVIRENGSAGAAMSGLGLQ